MSEMVERVARALWEKQEKNSGRDCWFSFDFVRPQYEGLARAAIAAMREPTEGMQNEAWKLFDNADETPRLVWQAMTDAALEPARAEAPAE